MQQQLNVQLSILIPEDKVLVSKIELEELRKNKLEGRSWTMKDLEEHTNRKSEWLQENILFVPKFKEKLDTRNGGFVYYPKGKGSPWAFQATKMAQFLDDNFHLIWRG